MKFELRWCAVAAVLSLTGCASTEIRNMPAQQLVSKGIEHAFDMPNYRFVASSGIDEIKLNTTNQLESDEDVTNFFSSFMSSLQKHSSAETIGVIDMPNKMYQMTPSFRYDSKNLKTMMAFPIVYDGQKKHLFADFSALDMFLNAPENSGKYSEFDLNAFSNHLDKSSKIIDVLKKNFIGHYEGLDKASFSDVPLDNDDKHQGVVRKVQVKTSVQKSLDMFPNIFKDVAGIFKPELTKNNDGQAIDAAKAVDASAEMDTAVDIDTDIEKSVMDNLKKFIAPESEQTEVLGFNNKGEVVQTDTKVRVVLNNPKPDEDTPSSKEPMIFAAHSKVRLYDIGTAKLIDAPTPENSVDGAENLKKSSLGKILLSIFGGTDKNDDDLIAFDAADAAEASAPSRGRGKHAHRSSSSKTKMRKHH
ncbi:hypothetical protein [Hydromonas duriensis]|uniref:Lipoprotein n=1 Tax=Hydromonas duriensis TaxID=1527608 RepID=A0A4R6Y8X5_9BURK|nr:hypothetical protein [Hydromonas duriensis]TDR31884.1 hypothetical protein DFR44_107101 [Hydromonas duriensis]